MNGALQAALSYVLDNEWSVIPISATSKKPLVKWKPYITRLPTEDEVRGWWLTWPKANVAIVTGQISGIVVADIDPDKGGDADEWLKQHPTTVTVDTKRGGVHCYYSLPSGGETIRNSVGRLAKGVDIRGYAGYVLAPGSNGYHWRSGTEPGATPMSEWDAANDGSAGRADNVAVEGGPVGAEHWIERTLQGVGSGERNNAAARLAGYFLGKGAAPDIVVAQLLTWNRLNDPPLPDGDIRIVVDSVARTERDRKKTGGTEYRFVGDTDGDSADDGGYSIIDFGSYLAKYGHQQVRWMVDSWLPTETVGMVVAPPGSYKTWLLQDLAISVATGMPFLGQFKVNHPGPVLFMQQEDWHGQTAHRFALIAAHRAGLKPPRMDGDKISFTAPPKIPIYLHEHRRFRFDDAAIVESWVNQIKRLRPSLVVLDPLYSAGSVEDFMAGTARAMFLFKHIRDSYGTTFLIAHHTRKASKDRFQGKKADAEPEREDVWGSQFLNAWLETGWQVRRREELGSATILRHFKVQSETAKAIISFNIDTTQLPTKYDVAIREAGTEPGAEPDGVDIVRVMEIGGSMSVAALTKATGLPRTTIYRKIENLVKAGVVEQTGNTYTLTERLDT